MEDFQWTFLKLVLQIPTWILNILQLVWNNQLFYFIINPKQAICIQTTSSSDWDFHIIIQIKNLKFPICHHTGGGGKRQARQVQEERKRIT